MTNPLTGPNGATFVFGKQKGADEKTSNILEAGMVNYASVLEREYQITIKDRKGAGAAGGLGANLVVTGEGRIDSQSVYEKVLFGIGQACKRQNVPCVAIAVVMGGSIGAF